MKTSTARLLVPVLALAAASTFAANGTFCQISYSLVSIPLSPVNAVIEFASTNVLADEFQPTVSVLVTRRGFTNAAVRVTVSTTNETAKAGEDYEEVSSFVTFAAGETNKVVEIPLLAEDDWAEPDKSFLVRISGLPPGATSPQSTARVLIRDDERPGSIDRSWASTLGLPPLAPGEVNYAYPENIWKQPNGQWLVSVGVYDSTLSYPSYYFLVRLNADGSVDQTYPIRRSMPRTPGGSIYARRTVMMPDGKMLVLDHEDTSPGTIEIHLSYLLNPDGLQDLSFPTISGSFDYDLIPQTDGKILVSASPGFGSSAAVLLNGQRMPRFFRLNSDGALDTNFNAPTDLLGNLRLLTNGQVYLQANTAPPYRLYQLNQNGTLDSSFTAPANVDLEIRQLLPNGQLLATSVAAQQFQSTRLYRLEPNGSLPSGYTVGTAAGPPHGIFSMVDQPDGKIVVAGIFRTFNGQVRNSLLRLNTNGVIDSTFQSGTGFTQGNANTPGQIYLSARPDGTMVASGSFDSYNGEEISPPILINPDGTRNRDASNEGTFVYAFGEVSRLPALFHHGEFVGSPSFGTDLGPFFASGYGLGRIQTDLPLRIISTAHDFDGATHLTANALTGRRYTLQASETLTNWSDLTTQSATTNRIEFTNTPTNSPAMRFYRVKQN